MSKIIRGYVKLRWRNEINRYEFTWMYKRIRSITQSRQHLILHTNLSHQTYEKENQVTLHLTFIPFIRTHELTQVMVSADSGTIFTSQMTGQITLSASS